MPNKCSMKMCKAPVAPELEAEGVCIAHFALAIEDACADFRRQTAQRNFGPDCCRQITEYVAARGQLLARVATSGQRIADDVKMRILNSLLSLINLRETLDRRLQTAAIIQRKIE